MTRVARVIHQQTTSVLPTAVSQLLAQPRPYSKCSRNGCGGRPDHTDALFSALEPSAGGQAGTRTESSGPKAQGELCRLGSALTASLSVALPLPVGLAQVELGLNGGVSWPGHRPI